MKKKLFSLLTALVLCLLCAVPAFAEMPLVMDTYELFKPEATAELEQKAQDASAGHGVNVYLLTVSDIGGQNVREFAKDWYRDYDLGYGEGKSGILFLIALDSRDYVTITYGGGVTAFTDYRIAQIEDKIVPMLSDGTYYKASDTYIEMCADTLDFREKRQPAQICSLLHGRDQQTPYRCRHHHSGCKAGEGTLDAIAQRLFQKEHTARPKTCAQKRNQDSPERILHDIVPPCG